MPKRFRVTIYDKGTMAPALPERRQVQVVSLPNTGREEQAYLEHMVRRYDDLADLTVFAQGKPFDHVPSFHKHLHAIAFNRMRVDAFWWMGFIIDEDDATGSRLFQRWSKNVEGAPLPFNAFFQALWGEPAPERVVFYPSAHFAVTADRIRSQPKSFYEKALTISAALPHAGHCFERVWDRIFGVQGIPLEYRDASKPVYLRKIRRATTGGTSNRKGRGFTD